MDYLVKLSGPAELTVTVRGVSSAHEAGRMAIEASKTSGGRQIFSVLSVCVADEPQEHGSNKIPLDIKGIFPNG